MQKNDFCYSPFILWRCAICLVLLASHTCSCSPDAMMQPPREWPDPGLVDLSKEWELVSPGVFEIDPDRMEDALSAGEDVEGLESIVIIKNGKLIGERYWEGNAATLRHIRSCTKSVVALLTGMALDSAAIMGLDEEVTHYLVPDIVPDVPEAISRLTFRQLLTMRTGLEWDEGRFTEWTEAPDQLEYALALPALTEPGTVFRYNSPASHLLGIGLGAACAEPLEQQAIRKLFQPLGIQTMEWETDQQGYAYGAFGLQLRTRDMARIGYALIQHGHSGIRPLIDSSYVASMTTYPGNTPSSRHAFKELGYGYLWWTDAGQYDDAYFAWGYGGQLLYCVPRQYLVVAITARWFVDGATDDRQLKAISHYLIDMVLPGVQ